MRLWHQSLIPYLPNRQLLGQHRECCALRGNGWGKKHSTVNYVFNHDYEALVAYHRRVLKEMVKRGYCPNIKWYAFNFYGNRTHDTTVSPIFMKYFKEENNEKNIYPEHDEKYLLDCEENLYNKYCNGRIEEKDWNKLKESKIWIFPI